MLSRASLLSLLLTAAIALVAAKLYFLWRDGPWELPRPHEGKSYPAAEEVKKVALPLQLVNAKNIIDRDLFDPERGAGEEQGEGGPVHGRAADTEPGPCRNDDIGRQPLCHPLRTGGLPFSRAKSSVRAARAYPPEIGRQFRGF